MAEFNPDSFLDETFNPDEFLADTDSAPAGGNLTSDTARAQAQMGISSALQDAANVPDNPLVYMAQAAGNYLGDAVTGDAPVNIPVISPLLDKFRSDEELAWRQNYQEQNPERAAAGDILTSAVVGGGVGKAAQLAAPVAGLGTAGTALVEAGLNAAGNRALTAADVAAQGGSMQDIAESQKGLAPAAIDIASMAIPGIRAAAPKIASTITGRSAKDFSKYADAPDVYKDARTPEDLLTQADQYAVDAQTAAEAAQQAVPVAQQTAVQELSAALGNQLGKQFGDASALRRTQAANTPIENLDDVTAVLGKYQDNPYVAGSVDKAIQGLTPDSSYESLLDLLYKVKPEKYKGSRLGGAQISKEDQVRQSLVRDIQNIMPDSVKAEQARIRDMAEAQRFLTAETKLRGEHPESLLGREMISKAANRLVESNTGNLDEALTRLNADQAREALTGLKSAQEQARISQQAAKEAESFAKAAPAEMQRAFVSSAAQDVPGSLAAVRRDAAMQNLSKVMEPAELEKARIAAAVSTPRGAQGSRLVTLMSNLGSVAGRPGQAVGAGVGAAMDYAGSKGLLDTARGLDVTTQAGMRSLAVPAAQEERRRQLDEYLQNKYPDRFNKNMTEAEQQSASAEAAFTESSTNPEIRKFINGKQ